MNVDGIPGARFARWWVDAMTRTAAGTIAFDRRAEIASDVHDQLADAWHRGALAQGSRAVVGRVVRGMPADIVWRVGLEARPSRFAWHLRSPSTAITALLVVTFPLNMAADAAWPAARASFVDYRVPLWTAADFAAVCVLCFAIMALVGRVWPRWTAGAERFQPHSRLARARRCATAVLGVTLAGSAVSRFGALDPVSGVLWISFASCVLIYAALIILTFAAKLLTLGRYLPKIRT